MHSGLTRSAVQQGGNGARAAASARDCWTGRPARQRDRGWTGVLESCVDILARVEEETEMQVSRLHNERKVLKINAPMSFGALYLGRWLASSCRPLPDLKIELTLNDRFIDPIEEGVDVTVRIGILATGVFSWPGGWHQRVACLSQPRAP